MEYFQNLYGLTQGNMVMPAQWTVPFMDEVEEIPLPTLEEVVFKAVKLEDIRASGPDRLNAQHSKAD
jgi:hypothetical protein